MAIYYNLAKVHALSEDDDDFVIQILQLFLTEVPEDLVHLDDAIEKKEYAEAHSFAHKMKPTIDLLGMNMTYEEILLIEDWAKRQGKRKEIKTVFQSVEQHIHKAMKEIRKDFSL
jgi:HPt (histidine-containing phosphotransfer) domain-containing protein